jgi:hypothetical protein
VLNWELLLVDIIGESWVVGKIVVMDREKKGKMKERRSVNCDVH